jgi:hypothetical protein
MAEGTSAGHAMPKGIKRVEKGRYATLDGRHEIHQEKAGWEVTELASGERVAEPFKNRGLAVAWLADHDLLPLEAPKPAEPEAKQEPEAKVTEATQGVGGRSGKATKAPRRPRTRKEPAKATA